jgi:hypothetical protein
VFAETSALHQSLRYIGAKNVWKPAEAGDYFLYSTRRFNELEFGETAPPVAGNVKRIVIAGHGEGVSKKIANSLANIDAQLTREVMHPLMTNYKGRAAIRRLQRNQPNRIFS